MITKEDISVAADAISATGIDSTVATILARMVLVAVTMARNAKKGRHGHRRDIFGKETPTHRVWRCMKERCQNRNHVAYASYGGRGIIVCSRWLDFKNFLADMGERPRDASLDRVCNDGNYSPGNCRWATRSEQQRNTRKSRFISIGGKSMSVAAAAEEAGVDRYIVYKRLNAGWSPERSLMSGDFRRRQIALG